MVSDFWKEFLQKTNREETTQYLECFHFELTEQLATKLLELVLLGKKRATASSLPYYQHTGAEIPKVGDLSIVTDWNGTPRCVIETTAVSIIPFHEITFEICKREGEDECLETWQQGHQRFFIAEGKELGYEFEENMPVVFEDFKVVFSK